MNGITARLRNNGNRIIFSKSQLLSPDSLTSDAARAVVKAVFITMHP